MKSTQIKYLLRFAGLHISHQSVPLEMYIDVYLLILTKLFITITSCSMNIMLLISYTFQQHKCYFLFRYWVCLVEHEYGHTHIYIFIQGGGKRIAQAKVENDWLFSGERLIKSFFAAISKCFFFFRCQKISFVARECDEYMRIHTLLFFGMEFNVWYGTKGGLDKLSALNWCGKLKKFWNWKYLEIS